MTSDTLPTRAGNAPTIPGSVQRDNDQNRISDNKIAGGDSSQSSNISDRGDSGSSSNPLSTARALVLLQLLSRLLTFGLNQTLLRLASPAVFGTAAIQFDLVCSSTLFLSREGIRNALLRCKEPSPNRGQNEVEPRRAVWERQARALSIVPLQLGLVISSIIITIYLTTSDKVTTSQPTFHLSLALYTLSSLIELSTEPLYIRVHRSDPPRLNVRVQAEGGMAITRAIVTVSCLIVLGESKALLGFAVGQVAGALWLAVRYLREFEWDIGSLVWLQSLQGFSLSYRERRFNSETLSLAIANTGQSFVKHLLTEADRIAVARISPLDDQGGYAVAMNYGSLVARIMFQPLEESLLLHYSSSLSSPSTLPLYTTTIRLSLYLTLLIRSFVPPLYPAIYPLLLPRQYHRTTAPHILKLYLTTYLPLMSLNGVSEAFVTSSADPDEVKTQARWMIASSAVFASSLVGFSQLVPNLYLCGPSGSTKLLNYSREESLVLSSCAAMVVRIIYALRHGYRTFSLRKPSLRVFELLPSLGVWAWTWVAWGLLWLLARTDRWKNGWKGWVELVGSGGALGVISLAGIFYAERRRFQELRRGTKAHKKD
ncbi:oligosaccharidyl-lipid flippase [Kwoniella heveanensis BCC8398]|uniref:Man(5)GlcNAc(2)-PP-dolichol translocation protein RFT1 n=1 Tax=Kwoniella heveanensis BCC8398 TaxID=1296120 RepID=A0A1B9GZW3_9TREE|nr:oligosaccharidyl-lipid flippase [Kwoniella heveanensis BCC8398]